MDPRLEIDPDSAAFQREVERLAASAGFAGSCRIVGIPGGANNKVFRVEHPRGRLLLKSYYLDGADSIERLNVEFDFSSFSWANGLRQAAQPLARDGRSLLALYEFIEGRPCRTADVGAEAVAQAARFFNELNAGKSLPAARGLPPARDACFSVADHFELVSKRLSLLRKIGTAAEAPALERDAGAFVRSSLDPLWDRLKRRAPADPERIPAGQRCLSPSDFGFHNALLGPEGRFRFFDFEYAGWDDPAKMIADFFSQVAVPVPEDRFDSFCAEATRVLENPEAIRDRARRVLAVHRLKWVCLLLNDFLPTVSDRRRFALGAEGFEERRAGQLEKARRGLTELQEGAWPI